jgi:hypothetical protein
MRSRLLEKTHAAETRSDRRAGNSNIGAGLLQCSRALIASSAEVSSLVSIRSAVFNQARAVSTKAC